MKAILIAVVICSIISCGSKDEKLTKLILSDMKSLEVDNLLPNSYMVSSAVEKKGDSLFFWDSSISKLVITDKNFKWRANLSVGIGQGPEEINYYAGHALANGQFLVFGSKCLVFDANSLNFVGRYDLPSDDIHWIRYFNGLYAIGTFSYERNAYQVYSAEFENEKGFFNLQKRVQIEFSELLDESSKYTDALVLNGHLYVLKLDLGHLVRINKNFQIDFDRRLAFSFSEKENIEKYEDGSLDVNILESWDFTTDGNNIFVLRTKDLANPDLGDNKVHMKTIHVIDQSGDAFGYFHLPERAQQISFVDNHFYAVTSYHENYYKYEVVY